jgi:hypothetical protein
MEKILKSGKGSVWRKLFFLSVLITFACFILLLFLIISSPEKFNFYILLPIIFISMISTVYCLSQILNLMVFGYDYSNLGPFKRTPHPHEMAIIASTCNWSISGVILFVRPFCTWTVFPSGLGILISGIGEAFIPISNILEIKRTSNVNKLLLAPPYEIIHNSPEVISPLGLSDKTIIEELQKLLDQHKS